MIRTTVTVEGLEQFKRAVQRVGGPQLKKALRDANREAAEKVAAEARGRAPQRSGRLARSIRPLAGVRFGGVRAGGARAPYAGVIHFGWPRHHIRPQPFLFGALDKRRDDVIAVYERRVAALVDAELGD